MVLAELTANGSQSGTVDRDASEAREYVRQLQPLRIKSVTVAAYIVQGWPRGDTSYGRFGGNRVSAEMERRWARTLEEALLPSISEQSENLPFSGQERDLGERESQSIWRK